MLFGDISSITYQLLTLDDLDGLAEGLGGLAGAALLHGRAGAARALILPRRRVSLSVLHRSLVLRGIFLRAGAVVAGESLGRRLHGRRRCLNPTLLAAAVAVGVRLKLAV